MGTSKYIKARDLIGKRIGKRIEVFADIGGNEVKEILVTDVYTNSNVGNGTSKLFLQNGSIIKNKSNGYTYVIMLPADSYIFDLSKPLVQHNLKIVQGDWIEGYFTGIGQFNKQ